MSNLEKYDNAFIECFKVGKECLSSLKFKEVPAWDSVGQMNLMAHIEESFEVELDPDDIIDFMSYEAGKEILSSHYQIDFAN